MKKTIVITSIFNPTEAVFGFSKMDDYQLIVVGDKKTQKTGIATMLIISLCSNKKTLALN